MSGNKIARFDPKTQTFKEWDMPSGHRPHGALVDKQGMVWTTGNGNGTIGKLDPASGKVIEYKTPSGRGGPHTLVITDDQRTIWFTMQSGDKVASLDTQSGAIREYASSGGPYGLSIDKAGNIYVSTDADKTGLLVFDASGRYLKTIAPEFSGIHGLMIREENGKEFIYAAHVKNFVFRRNLPLRAMEWTWPKRAMQFTDLGSGDQGTGSSVPVHHFAFSRARANARRASSK